MRHLVVLAVTVVVLGATMAGVAIADPNLNLTTTAHRHYINGVEVGPRYCENADLRDAFTQFHTNIHSHNGVTGEIGPVAPGLQPGSNRTIVSGAC